MTSECDKEREGKEGEREKEEEEEGQWGNERNNQKEKKDREGMSEGMREKREIIDKRRREREWERIER